MVGPHLNKVYKKHNNRDPLGIDGVSQSIVGDLSPIINSVTPHAIYWIFVNWVYYDFYENRKKYNLKQKELNLYLKKMNYFMVMGNIFNGIDVNDMVGVTNIRKDILKNKNEFYSYQDNYIQVLTGINYYKAAMTSAGFITFTDLDGNEYQHLKFTKKGQELALSIDKYIKNTKFYSDYVLKDIYYDIPYDVIKEFGNVVSVKLNELSESKILLKKFFFDTNIKLSLQSEFIKYLYYDLKMKDISDNSLRVFLYDYFSIRSLNNYIPENLTEIVKGWEVLIARHYFTNSLEMIFLYVLEKLVSPIYLDDFIDALTENVSTQKLSTYINEYNLNGNEINDLLVFGKSKRNSHDKNIDNSIKILASLYNRLYDRNDINNNYLLLDNDGASISLNTVLKDINEFKKSSVRDYAKYILKEYVINQHIKTAKRKMALNEDSFYFSYFDNIIYNIKVYDYDFKYQNLRINNLFQVMKELDMLGDK